MQIELLLTLTITVGSILFIRWINGKYRFSDTDETDERLKKLWDAAQQAMRTRKFLPAEKALLTILKIDHKNAPAYNKLGILYAKREQYDDAIECFEVSTSIEPQAASLHNLGLIYFETEQYKKALDSFNRAVDIEPTAARHVARAKVFDRQKDKKSVIEALESAVELDSSTKIAEILISEYEAAGRAEDSKKLAKTITTKKAQTTGRRARKTN